MIRKIFDLLANVPFVNIALAGICAAALGMAYMAEYVFGLAPCILCLYQRIPYFIVIGLGCLGLLMFKKKPQIAIITIALSGIALLANSIIAFYHTGVEQKWWPSHLEGCATPDLSGDFEDLLARIESAPVVRCDEIPWADPILNLSMANYNVVFCLGLAVIAFISVKLARAN